jgi:LmbE family N-acetylglucosaminyl deacetylase
MKGEKILVLSPHIDDAEIGCGATIAKLIEKGYCVEYLVIAERHPKENYASITELELASKIMGVESFSIMDIPVRYFEEFIKEITNEIWKYVNVNKPYIVYMPSMNSRHEDHSAVAIACHRATGRIPVNVLGYHTLGDSINFAPTYFEVVEERHIQKKLAAIQAYKSQYEVRAHYFTEDNFRSHTKFYSSLIGVEYVEPFEVIKWVNA